MQVRVLTPLQVAMRSCGHSNDDSMLSHPDRFLKVISALLRRADADDTPACAAVGLPSLLMARSSASGGPARCYWTTEALADAIRAARNAEVPPPHLPLPFPVLSCSRALPGPSTTPTAHSHPPITAAHASLLLR